MQFVAPSAVQRLRALVGGFGVVCALAAVNCGFKLPARAEKIAVTLVGATHGVGGERVPQARLDAIVEPPFSKAGRFRLNRGAGDGVDGALWFDVETARGGARRVELSLSIARGAGLPAGGGRGALEAMVQVDSSAAADDSDDEAVREALSLALGIIDAQVSLERGEEARIPALLRSNDPQVVLLAMAWVRQRERTEFLAHVVAALDHRHPDVAIAAVETLGLIGHASHVPEILQQAPRLQIASSFRLYEALGRLGGPDAEAFLEFAARNEEDPALRSAARRALHSRGRPGDRGADPIEPPTAAAARGHWRTP